ncbi:MAG: helix-turn-helix domain-containing protein [Blastocatellia bacterium]
MAEQQNRLTKKEAAEFLGVSEKAIERYANAGKLSKQVENKLGGGVITYYDHKEVEQLKQQMDTRATTPRQTDTPTGKAPGKSTALARRDSATLGRSDTLALIVAAIEQARAQTPLVEVKEKEFLTIKEAAALKGLSVSHIEQAIKSKKLAAMKLAGVRGRRIRRAALDKYTSKL